MNEDAFLDEAADEELADTLQKLVTEPNQRSSKTLVARRRIEMLMELRQLKELNEDIDLTDLV
jgi:hypothetical protein